MIKGIDHFGIVVRRIEDVKDFYEKGLGIPIGKSESIPEQGVRIAMMRIGGIRMELIEPLSDSSPVSKFLSKRGPGMHHICFQVDNIERTSKRLNEAGVKMIERASGAGAGGSKVLFIHPSSSGHVLFEFVEV
jgi:methylmalonyl-CoA/ethylmalonyl-CoA epimerase